MASKAEITVKDSGWSLVADLLELDGDELQAGVLEGTDAHEGISTASLALIHEDGAPAAHIPARPFMRPTFDSNLEAYVDALEDITARTAEGRASGHEVVELADTMATDLQETILQGRTGGPAVSGGSGVPLIDTGALVASLQGQVVKGASSRG